MTANAENVLATIMGRAYVATTSATGPTAAIQALNGFTNLGHIADSGFDYKPERSTKEIKNMNGEVVRVLVTDKKETYNITLLETTQATLELFHGAPMVNGKISTDPGNTGGRKSFVFDCIDGAKLVRHYVPSGELVSVEPLSYKEGEPVTYGLSIIAYPTALPPSIVFYAEFESN